MTSTQPWSNILVELIQDTLELEADRPQLIFLGGSQGVGKTTALEAVGAAFPSQCLMLSLDDFYLTLEDRIQLSNQVHPLFLTRGAPGTHDLALLNDVLDQCCDGATSVSMSIPVFDKRKDDRLPKSEWRSFHGQPKVILLEGWLLGVKPNFGSPVADPMNPLEASRDPQGHWRQFQEEALSTNYSKVWDRADQFVYALPQDFSYVFQWRLQQEAKTYGVDLSELPQERRVWVQQFVAHYERLTKRMIAGKHRRGSRMNLDSNRTVIDPFDY